MRVEIAGEPLEPAYGVNIQVLPEMDGRRRISSYLTRLDDLGLVRTVGIIRGELRLIDKGEDRP